jgi:UDPglucose 6-dehydrogenase
MKIGIVGKGTVGSAVYDGMKSIGHDVSFYDPAYPESKIEDVLDTQVVFVSVPTDQSPDGRCDTTIVEGVVELLNDLGYLGLIAIKSTIEPGTCRRLQKKFPLMRLCSVPEFLRAKSALADFVYNHDLLVIGSDRDEDYEIIEEAHGNLPQRVARVNPTEAEVVKYFNNVHHAMSITFANIAFEVCDALDSDYEKVYNAITQRTCFNPAYLRSNRNVKAFGGHCLPKDTSAWNYLIKNLGLDFTLIQAVLDDNERFKGEDH